MRLQSFHSPCVPVMDNLRQPKTCWRHVPVTTCGLMEPHWPVETPLQTKLYNLQQGLERTVRFVRQTGLSLQSACDKKRTPNLIWLASILLKGYSLQPFCLARRSMFSVGSEPMDRKPIRGVRLVDSAHMVSRLRITPSANCNTSTYPLHETQGHTGWKQKSEKPQDSLEVQRAAFGAIGKHPCGGPGGYTGGHRPVPLWGSRWLYWWPQASTSVGV